LAEIYIKYDERAVQIDQSIQRPTKKKGFEEGYQPPEIKNKRKLQRSIGGLLHLLNGR